MQKVFQMAFQDQSDILGEYSPTNINGSVLTPSITLGQRKNVLIDAATHATRATRVVSVPVVGPHCIGVARVGPGRWKSGTHSRQEKGVPTASLTVS